MGLPVNVGAALEEDRSVVPLRSTPAFGRAEPTLTDGEAVGEDGAPGSLVLGWLVGEKERPGVSRVSCVCAVFEFGNGGGTVCRMGLPVNDCAACEEDRPVIPQRSTSAFGKAETGHPR